MSGFFTLASRQTSRLVDVKRHHTLSSFIIQIVQTGDDTLITVQNIKTRETCSRLSWNDILSLMQKACVTEGQKNNLDNSQEYSA